MVLQQEIATTAFVYEEVSQLRRSQLASARPNRRIQTRILARSQFLVLTSIVADINL